jgi:hypothetical protein
MRSLRHPRVAARDNAGGVAGGDPSKYQSEFKFLAWTGPRLRGDDENRRAMFPHNSGVA